MFHLLLGYFGYLHRITHQYLKLLLFLREWVYYMAMNADVAITLVTVALGSSTAACQQLALI